MNVFENLGKNIDEKINGLEARWKNNGFGKVTLRWDTILGGTMDDMKSYARCIVFAHTLAVSDVQVYIGPENVCYAHPVTVLVTAFLPSDKDVLSRRGFKIVEVLDSDTVTE